jgi:thiol oxidase
MLFHTLTVRVEDFEGSFAITAIEAFVDDFYKCDHCRAHFRNVTNRWDIFWLSCRFSVV